MFIRRFGALIFLLFLTGCLQPSGESAANKSVTHPLPTSPQPGHVPVVTLSDSRTCNGGCDGGGGEADSSTAEQVKAAIDLAYRLSTEDEPRRNIIHRFFIQGTQRLDSEFELKIIVPHELLFPNIETWQQPFHTWMDKDLSKKLESKVLSALKSKKLRLIEDGYCPAADKKHAEASVTSFDLNGEICFSVMALKRIPPRSLFKEVMGLLIHELVHLGGGNEEQAKIWQSVFDGYFVNTYGFAGNENLVVRHHLASAFQMKVMIGVLRKQLLMDTHTSMGSTRYKDGTLPVLDEARAIATFSSLALSLANLPYIFDPVGLRLAMNPKNPHLDDNYVNALRVAFNRAWSVTDLETRRNTSHPIKPAPRTAELRKLVLTFEKDIARIEKNLAAFKDGEGQSECVLPDEKDEAGLLQWLLSPGDILTTKFRSLPPLICSPGTSPAAGTNPDSDKR